MSLANFEPKPDPMMEELQKIREQINETATQLSPEERIRWFNQKAEEILADKGKVLVTHPTIPRAWSMVSES
jgi:hypothetical protein